jgi:hypothetical protein
MTIHSIREIENIDAPCVEEYCGRSSTHWARITMFGITVLIPLCDRHAEILQGKYDC